MTTVVSLVQRLLPRGSTIGNSGIDRIPVSPMDVFAVVATLLDRSGAYRDVVAPDAECLITDPLGLTENGWMALLPRLGKAWSYGLVGLSDEDETGSAFQDLRDVYGPDRPPWEDLTPAEQQRHPKHVYLSFEDLLKVDVSPLQREWSSLIADPKSEVCPPNMEGVEPWWRSALRLMIAADTACAGAGFMPRMLKGRPSLKNWVQMEIARAAADAPYGCRVTTIASPLVEQGLATVLPKTRTPGVGCTLRSLTHNLALLPPTGRVAARWHIQKERPVGAVTYRDSDLPSRPLNLLLIPFPFNIRTKSFRAEPSKDQRNWGYFSIDQDWLRSPDPEMTPAQSIHELCAFVEALVRKAAADLGEVNGVIFPEYSLDPAAFRAVSEHLRQSAKETGFEFLVAGTKGDPTIADAGNGHGNYASFRGLFRNAHAETACESWAVEASRAKHHRWKLDKRQIERYGLAAKLEPTLNWWEAISIPHRTVDFFEVRAGTTMTVMICEDLARNDPCQEIIRSVGPNLLIALLMDGPQRAFRWPGHYAGVLADDPGSSVLTLTSYAFMNRASATDKDQSRSIAFFRDSEGGQTELLLPTGFHALGVRLSAQAREEGTLDGRGDGGTAHVWRLDEVCPVADRQINGRVWILG